MIGAGDHDRQAAASARRRGTEALLGSDPGGLLDAIVGANPFAIPVRRRFPAAFEEVVARFTSA